MNAPHLPTLPSLPPRAGTAAAAPPPAAFPPPSPFAAPVVATAATFAAPPQPTSAAPLPSPTIPPPPPSQTSVRQVHAPIDIAALRRPKRKIRSTLVTTTVVGIFLAGLTTGVVLAWRTIAESSADSSAATETTTGAGTADTVAPAGVVTPTAAPLQVAGANWVEYSHTPLTVRVPPAATVQVDGTATKYQSDTDRLVVVVGPYTAVGSEEQIFRDLVANLSSTLHGTAGATTPVHSLGTAFQVVIAGPDGTWTHVRGLFLGGMSVIIAGQGDQAEPSAVHVAWMSIGYGGVNATGA